LFDVSIVLFLSLVCYIIQCRSSSLFNSLSETYLCIKQDLEVETNNCI
jgi:hypothetical protein